MNIIIIVIVKNVKNKERTNKNYVNHNLATIMWYSNNNNGGKMSIVKKKTSLDYILELDPLNLLHDNEQLNLPLWEDEDIESEDYIETINKNGKIKMEEE
jgi:hypothetical protein|tara:strand:+ start:149 stop:448 length:300 start_codon:yes stop_codon:yes gene_type:complete